ncbi:MAG: protein phosphatase 2C domain-containing protein [Candidatus Eremiobacteraeota bacterium]|nr:protein phosphatase 2C domain-containing protein [Candidatus Eremiobacteraeota bacterium]MBV8370460.1 protein phosphatase 2C domain-containing protein [Candidatus Eremiobacteraeota bacterium]
MEIAVGSRPGVPQRGGDEAYVAEIVAPGIVLLAVAHGFGRIRERTAPAVAALAVRDHLKRRVRGERRDPRTALSAAFSAANARIYAHSGSTDDYVASGTSLTAALIVGDHAFVGHVGATRAYLGRDGALTTLTSDDTVGDGTLRLLTRTLGTQPSLEPSLAHLRLMHGDALVLASGALHELLDEDEIADALRASASSEDVTARLLAIAGIRGDGAATVIVGRAFNEVASESASPHPRVREASIALAAVLVATIVALLILHNMFSL